MGTANKLRELPHDLLAEKSLIGCLILDSSSFDEISDLTLRQDDFYHPQYGVIFEAIRDLSIANKPIDYVTACSKLTSKGQLELVGGQQFVLDIVEDQASSANVYHYAKVVKDKSSIRNIVRMASRIVEQGMDYKGDAEEFVGEVESAFFKLTVESKTGKMLRLNQCLQENLKELEANKENKGEISGLPTGYTKLDEILLGMQPGQLIVLAGRPAMGKTSLALNIGVKASESTGLPVAIFSLEMLAAELSMRILTSKAKVDSKRLRTKNFLDTDLRNIGNAINELAALPVYIEDSGYITLPDIQSRCRKIKAEQGLGLVVIDYLQLMRSHTNNPSREQQISEISRGLKTMAKELSCPVMALSQLNRGVEARNEKRPLMSDLRESGSIEQDADIVMMVYRDEVYNKDTKEPGIAEVIVTKNRSGENGVAKLAFIGAHTSFENLSYEVQNRDF